MYLLILRCIYVSNRYRREHLPRTCGDDPPGTPWHDLYVFGCVWMVYWNLCECKYYATFAVRMQSGVHHRRAQWNAVHDFMHLSRVYILTNAYIY